MTVYFLIIKQIMKWFEDLAEGLEVKSIKAKATDDFFIKVRKILNDLVLILKFSILAQLFKIWFFYLPQNFEFGLTVYVLRETEVYENSWKSKVTLVLVQLVRVCYYK